MKQEILIPDGYEFSSMAEPILSNGGGCLSVFIKKKNIKDFNFYIDEYLRTDECTTNDMLCNWMTSFEIDRLKDNLKQNKLQFVPWEVKIGLFKFICKDMSLNYKIMIYNMRLLSDKLTNVLPIGFFSDIIA